ncbi:MAG: helix-turn-helix domain-containing protein [Promethearchaeota archaeon]
MVVNCREGANEAEKGEEPADSTCFCPAEGIIHTISRKWALLVVALVSNHGVLRFNELRARLPGVSPKTLSDRLKELCRAGILRRTSHDEIPPRVEYSLTPDGVALRDALRPLLAWAHEHDQRKN